MSIEPRKAPTGLKDQGMSPKPEIPNHQSRGAGNISETRQISKKKKGRSDHFKMICKQKHPWWHVCFHHPLVEGKRLSARGYHMRGGLSLDVSQWNSFQRQKSHEDLQAILNEDMTPENEKTTSQLRDGDKTIATTVWQRVLAAHNCRTVSRSVLKPLNANETKVGISPHAHKWQ
eukprot:5240990-Amphidinium_carterae.1